VKSIAELYLQKLKLGKNKTIKIEETARQNGFVSCETLIAPVGELF